MRIAIYLDAITGGFETDLVRAQKISARAFKEIKKEAADANKRLGNLFAGAIAASAAGFAFAVKKGVDHMDDLSKAAQRAGVTTEFLSAAQYAAKLADVSVEGLGGAFKKLSVNMAEAQAKEGDLRELFSKTLGIDIQNADGSLRDLSDIFPEIADRFANMRDGAEKTAIAVKLFGRAGADLIPLLNGGAEGFRAATDEAKEFGLVVSTESGKAAEEFNDQLTRIGSIAQGAGLELAQYLLPTLKELADNALALAKDPEFKEGLAQTIRTIGEVAISASKGIVTLTNNLGYLWDEVKQRVGIVDDDDIVRLQEEHDKLAGVLKLLEANPQRDTNSAFERETRAALATVDARIKLAEDVIAAKVRAEQVGAGLQEIDASAFPKKFFTYIEPPKLTDPAAAREQEKLAKQLAKLRLDALGEEEKGIEELKQKYAELDALVAKNAASAAQAAEIRAGLARQFVEPLRQDSLTEEEGAIEALQLKYTKLNNAVAAGALSREKADEIGARYAEQWKKAEEDRIYQFRVATGQVTEQEAALHSLRQEMGAIQRVADASAGGLPGGIAGFSQEEADKLKAQAQARFDQQQALQNKDAFQSFTSQLAPVSDYDLSPLERQLERERRTINEHYDALEDDALRNTQLREDQVTEIMVRSAAARKDALAEVDKEQRDATAQAVGAAFGELTALMQSHNQTLFRIGKAAAIAQAGVSAGINLAKASEAGFPANLVFIAGAIAQIAQIASIIESAQPPAYDAGGSIPAGELGWVAEKGNEVISAKREPMLLTRPTLVKGPAHVTGRRETERLMRDREKFAGMFDQGGYIPAGSYGGVAERRPELLRADGVSMPSLAPAAARQEQRPVVQKHVHVWSMEQLNNELASSSSFEQTVVHIVNRNPSRTR